MAYRCILNPAYECTGCGDCNEPGDTDEEREEREFEDYLDWKMEQSMEDLNDSETDDI